MLFPWLIAAYISIFMFKYLTEILKKSWRSYNEFDVHKVETFVNFWKYRYLDLPPPARPKLLIFSLLSKFNKKKYLKKMFPLKKITKLMSIWPELSLKKKKWLLLNFFDWLGNLDSQKIRNLTRMFKFYANSPFRVCFFTSRWGKYAAC